LCQNLKTLIFKDCFFLDDWALTKLVHFNFDKLEVRSLSVLPLNNVKLFHPLGTPAVSFPTVSKSEFSYSNYIKYLEIVKFKIEKELFIMNDDINVGVGFNNDKWNMNI
jgi:hypothetical protein